MISFNVLVNDDISEIKYVYHMSDIHIRILKRKQEYEEQIEKTKEKINEFIGNSVDESLIVVTGDIMHHKTELSPEAIDLVNYFYVNLTDVAPVIIIAGNHDCNLSNINRTDALSPIIKNGEDYEKYSIYDPSYKLIIAKKFRKHKLYYLRKSGFYRYHNIVFGVTCVYDDILLTADKMNHNEFKKIKQNNKYKIALYHGKINGSNINSNYKLVNEILNAGDFEGYDYVMLGDIHKFQFMNKEKTIAYAGSLIQQSHGETIENHGFLRWNLLNNSKKYIEVPNDYGYCTINIINGKMVNTFIPKKPRIRFVLENTCNSDYLKIRKKIIDKYEVDEIAKEASVKLQLLDGVINNNKTADRDIMHISKIKQYLAKKKIDTKIINSVVKIHQKICDKLISENKYNILYNKRLSTHQSWEILELRFSNMLSYGENNIINFAQYEPNQVIGIFAPNHYGKSAIIDIILYCLFGEWSRGINVNRKIMNNDKNNFHCSLKFQVGNKIYLIEKSAKRSKTGLRTTPKVEFSLITYENDIEHKTILNGDRKTNTDKLIRDLVGDYNDYLTTCICLDKSKNDFIDMTANKQMEYLQDILNIDIFQYCHIYCKQKLNILNIDISVLEKQMENFDIKYIKRKMKLIKNKIKICKQKKKDFLKFQELIVIPKHPVLTKYNELSKYDLNTEHSILDNINNIKKILNNINVQSPDDEKYKKINAELNNTNFILNDLDDKLSMLSKNIINVPEVYKNYNIVVERKNKKILINKISVIENEIMDFSHLTDEHILLVVNNIKDKIHELKKQIIHINPNILEMLEMLHNQIYENENIIIDASKQYFSQIQNDIFINENNVHNIIKIKDEHAIRIKNILNKLKMCMNNKISDHTFKILLSIIVDNKKWLKTYTKWKNQLNEIINSNKNSNISELFSISKKLRVQQIDLSIDFLLLKDSNIAKNKIEKLKQIKRKYKNILILRRELMHIKNQLFDIDNKILQLTHIESNNVLLHKIKLINDEIEKNMTVKNKLTNELDLCQTQIDNDVVIFNKKKSIKNDLQLLNKYYIEFVNCNETLQKYKKLTQEKKKIEIEISRINEKCNGYYRDYDIYKKNLKYYYANKKIRDAKIEKREIYEIYKTMMNNKGLATLIINEYLPDIAAKINDVLTSFTVFSIEIKFVENENMNNKHKQYLSNYNKKYFGNIDILICHKNKNPYSITQGSGFEQLIVGIAIRLTLSHISLLAKPNFFIIDEGWSRMDSENRNNIDVVINYIKELYDHVIIISHLDDLKSQSDYNINIEKINGFSHVSNQRGITNVIKKFNKNTKIIEV